MAYEALARKWRPKTFAEIVGQAHVTRALTNAISQKKIHHAYLFSGTRGVGKTTFARLLARALNCEKGPTATPCLECVACREILSGASTDVQEIDGASNTGIDDIRRLRDSAAYAPARFRYKIYIIDEVHMLSKNAFNGLLKILEEPPAHVVFIFATTEPNRIPDTIHSRVQRFDFRMLTEEEIFSRLKEMAASEKIGFEDEALRLMSRYAFGSMRDGQSLLEQAAVSGDGKITSSYVEEMLGLVGTEAAIDLVAAVASEGAEGALRKFGTLLSRGADLKFLFLSVVDVLRDAAVYKFTGKEELLFRHSPSSLERMKELCAKKGREEWMFLLDIAFRSEKDVLASEFPRLGFELLMLRLVNAPGLLSVEGLESGAPDPPAAKSPASPAPAPQTTYAKRPAPPPSSPATDVSSAPSAAASAKEEGGRFWDSVRKHLESRRKTLLLGLLSQMKGTREDDVLVISCPHEMVLERLKEEDKWGALLQAVEEVAGKKLEVRLSASAEKKSPEPDAVGQDRGSLERKALSDPLVLEVLREFDGATVMEIRPFRKEPPPLADVESGEENGGAADGDKGVEE